MEAGATALAGAEIDALDASGMARQARQRGKWTIDAQMWAGVVMAIVTRPTIDPFRPGCLIDRHAGLTRSRAAGFTVLVVAQLSDCFSALSEKASALRGLRAGRWLWAPVALLACFWVADVYLAVLPIDKRWLPVSTGHHRPDTGQQVARMPCPVVWRHGGPVKVIGHTWANGPASSRYGRAAGSTVARQEYGNAHCHAW